MIAADSTAGVLKAGEIATGIAAADDSVAKAIVVGEPQSQFLRPHYQSMIFYMTS